MNLPSTLVARAARVTPQPLARRMRGLSDRAIAWLFIAPTMLLLLAINVFPLIWTIRLSFTNYRANKPNVPLRWLGLGNYTRGRLGGHAGDGAFRDLDDPAGGAVRLWPRPADRQEIPRP